MNLSDHLRGILTIDPAARAVEDRRVAITWGDLDRFSVNLQALLEQAGVAPEAPIACLLRNRTENVAVLIAALTLGRTVITVNPAQGADRLRNDLVSLHPSVVIADGDVWESTELPRLCHELGAAAIKAAASGPQLLASATATSAGAAELPPDTAVLMLTSGTTGPPKRVPLFYRALTDSLLAADHYGSRKIGLRLSSGVRVVTGPLVHISGIWDVLTSVVAGRRMAVLERFDVADWLSLVETHRPKAASLVPTALRMVYAANLDPDRLSSLQVITCGTAPIDPHEVELFEARYGIPVLVLYGATEFAGGVTGWTLDDRKRFAATKRGSVGRAHPGIELRIVDRDTLAPLPAREIGLLEVRGPQLGRDRGWVRTTDLGVLDDDGFLWIKGRVDDAIIRGGFKIVPADIERVLTSHERVHEASVVGKPDERLGAVPVAAVQPVAGQSVDADEMSEFAKANLLGYQVPVAFRIVDELPRTPSLKVSRPDVLRLFSDA